MQDPVRVVDLHHVAPSQLRLVLLDERACRCVLVLEHARLGCGGEEVVVREEGESGGFDVVLQFADGRGKRKRSEGEKGGKEGVSEKGETGDKGKGFKEVIERRAG
jgi:hypothetical protein